MTMKQTRPAGKLSRAFSLIKESLNGKEADYTSGSIRRAVILLAIPMMLEMILESVFALVDLYFVGHLHNSSVAVQTVGLTESVLTVIYSLAIGISMAATAVVARRIGEKNPEAAARAGIQAILIAFAITLLISVSGVIYARDILLLMGASDETARQGTPFVRIMIGSSLVIMFLFLINGIFRGAGNAAIAMKSLWLANIMNIILCPILINGWGPIPALGLTGAALATAIGRGSGVLYQLYNLFSGKGILKIRLHYFIPDWPQIGSLLKIAAPGVMQFVIASCSWIFLAYLVAKTGSEAGSAGYQTALRLMTFFILPAWGLSNAASTLVGQNLGAGQLKRAEESVLKTVKYNILFMAVVTLLFLACGHWFVAFFTDDAEIRNVAARALRYISLGYIFYGIGMVMINAFNGAGDTWTPTLINFVGFWLFQVPFAWFLARGLSMGPDGVFIAIPVAETAISIAGFFVFRGGRWKKVKV